MLENTTIAEETQWNSKPAWKLPGWAEPLMVMTILFGAMFVTRKRGYRVFKRRSGVYKSAMEGDDTACSSDELLDHDARNEDDAQEILSTTPSHSTFATVRLTMNLTNFMAFTTYVIYPCMPPRLLPKGYGFLDTVRHDDAQSVWTSGKFVNSLAAMPSVHFAYAFAIDCTLIYHSGILRRKLEYGQVRKSMAWKVWYLILGVGYPAMILTAIVATANYYLLDALIAAIYVLSAFMSNKVFYVFIPLEDWFLWAIRVEKPIASTGERIKHSSLHV
ncbi:hypothetical protein E4T47_08535 [Aureobasidium subglaciale]|nr:hypothetical protein E4T47_08535 [Aureobasidium subglaciale]